MAIQASKQHRVWERSEKHFWSLLESVFFFAFSDDDSLFKIKQGHLLNNIWHHNTKGAKK